MQWSNDPNQSNADNLTNVRRGGSGHFRKKEREYLKSKINALETRSKLNRWRNDFLQLLNAHWVIDVRRTEKHTAETLVSELSPFDG
jgi:hypothetical protein